MANQRRHAHYARTGRQLTPRTSHPGTPTAQTPHVDAPRYTIPDYLRGHRAGTQHALSQDFRILTIEVEEPPQLSMKVSFSEDVKFEGKGEFSQLSAIKSSIRDLVAVGHSRSIKKGQIIGVAAVIAFLLTITITTVLQTLNQVHLDAQSDVQMSTIIQNYSEALGKVDDSSSAMLTQYQNLSPTAKLDTKIDFLLQEQATELRQQITIGEVLGRENHMERSLYDNFPGPWWARSPQLALGLGILAAMVVAALTRAFLPETGSVFLLGAGARKLERSKKRKQFICWQVILPLAIGILAGILVLKIPL